ncbi:MAG: magnesium transporter [Acholeplasmataceae bacterium]|nr:magnesium transporter [Acholeplasmataceae bacterium]
MSKKINFKHSDDALKKTFKSLHAYDLAVLFDQLDHDEKIRVIHLVDSMKLADIFVSLEEEDQLEFFDLLDTSKKKLILKNMESDDLKAFIENIDENRQEEIINLLSAVKRKAIRLLLAYDEDLAASIMSTDFITISQDLPVKEATDLIVKTSKEQDYIDTIYVINDDKKMIGFVDLKQLIMTRGNKKISDVMEEDFQFVYVLDSIEKAIQTVRDYDRNSIPVLDQGHHVLGIVTADDIFDEIVESSEEDYQKLASISDFDSTSSAIRRSAQRLPWLMIAVVLNLATASFLSIFEVTLVQVAALILFQPTILGMSGNIGTQSLAVTILGLHLEEIDSKKMPKKHVYKEMTIAFINSLTLALVAFTYVTVFLTIVPIGNQTPLQISTVVFLSVFMSMFIAGSMGALVPVIFNHFGIDPSAASGPIMTTINDVITLVIYFGIATLAIL